MSDIKTFSDAVPVLQTHGLQYRHLGSGRWQVGTLEYDKRGVIALARELAARGPVLSPEMQIIACNYIAMRAKAGEALLQAARYLAQARATAKHGEWGMFLAATNTSEDWAVRLLRIAEDAERDPRIAEAIRTNFLSLSTAYELSSAPPDVQSRLLESTEPPTRKQIRDEKQAANPAPVRIFTDPPAETPTDAEFASVRERFTVQGWQLRKHGIWFVMTPPGRTVGISEPHWAHVVEKIAYLEQRASPLVVGQRTDPNKPDPKEPPLAQAADDEGGSDRKAYEAKEWADRKFLDDAEIAIERGAYAYARQLLDRIQVSTYQRDQLLVTIPVEQPAEQASDDARRRAIALLNQLAPLMEQIRCESLEDLSMAISDLNECEEGTEARHWLKVGYALLDTESEL